MGDGVEAPGVYSGSGCFRRGHRGRPFFLLRGWHGNKAWGLLATSEGVLPSHKLSSYWSSQLFVRLCFLSPHPCRQGT